MIWLIAVQQTHTKFEFQDKKKVKRFPSIQDIKLKHKCPCSKSQCGCKRRALEALAKKTELSFPALFSFASLRIPQQSSNNSRLLFIKQILSRNKPKQLQVIYFNRATSTSVNKYFSNTVQKVKGMHTSFECD